MFGGGMRQTGLLAASAAYALNLNFPKLKQTHDLARRLGAGLKDAGFNITPVETNMVSLEHG